MVTLGGLAGRVASWSDTRAVTTVASGSLTSIARVQQNSVASNSLAFTVTGTGGSVSKLVPTVINMAVGDTPTIQALSAANLPVTGLTWTSSDPTVVSLSTDDPPILSALTVGHVTITAGGASADVTVSATLSLGTVLWSNPGDGSGVSSIVPAVPSSTGVADVFAFQNDGTVQAITADGTVAWTASAASCEAPLPDFQGGLILAMCGGNAYDQGGTIVKLDGLTGQTVASIAINGTYPDQVVGLAGPPAAVIHPDGTIFTILYNGNTMPPTVAGYDSLTGAQKFAVPFNLGSLGQSTNKLIIAGDGYAYMPYQTIGDAGPGFVSHNQRLLRVNSSGAYDDISVMDWVGAINGDPYYDFVSIITNADTGVVMTVQTQSGVFIATTTGASVSVSSVAIPSAAALGSNNYPSLAPALQAQDGSFVGTMGIPVDYGVFSYMVNFDASGNIRWSVPNESPMIATADGGVIGASGVTYDSGGNVTGLIDDPLTQSWTGFGYRLGSVDQLRWNALSIATSWWPFKGANASGNGTSTKLDWFPPLDHCSTSPGCIGHYEAIYNALSDLIVRLSDPTVAAAADAMVFNLLEKDAKGNKLSTKGFISYLTSKRPGFYNGLASNYCYAALTSPGVSSLSFCRWWLVRVLYTTVGDTFAYSPGYSALTGTPSDGLLTFFRPTSILYANLGKNAGNEALIFHEALHGITGVYDLGIENALGTGGPSCMIETYIQSNVLSKSSGLNPTNNTCP